MTKEHGRMKPLIEKVWDSLNSICNQLKGKTSILFREEAYSEFEKHFIYCYDTFLHDFMTEETEELDEHKQAAVIVISAIKSNAIQQSVESNEIALAPYAIALNVGLSFLLDRINERLLAVGKEKIEVFQLPCPIACNTPYFESLCRVLYYENSNEGKSGISYSMSLNMVELADRFFLLEYILLLNNGINPLILKNKSV